jgi:membrane fusion protein, multidrug efflux system
MTPATNNEPTPSTPPTHEKRRWSRIVVVVAVLIVLALVVLHLVRRKPAARGTQAQVVSVAKAVQGDMPETLNALGTVTPIATVTVLPQLSGYLTSVGYKEGEDVTKGQFLAQIDPRQYEIDKQQAEAQLAKDRASLSQAHADLARYTQLHAQKSIAEQTFADQQFTVQQDEAAVQADIANIKQYDLDLTYCRIVAPVSGRVGLRLVDPGNYVTASSSPGIAVITTITPTTVEFAVPQDSLGTILKRFQSGAKLAVTAMTSDNTRQLGTGTLYAISNQIVTSTGTVTLRAEFANGDKILFPNEFVNVKLLVDTLHNALLVPAAAVQSGAPGNFVYRVNANDTVSVNKVQTGASDGVHTVVTSGLAADATVVTDGMDRLSDGAKIRVSGATKTALQK